MVFSKRLERETSFFGTSSFCDYLVTFREIVRDFVAPRCGLTEIVNLHGPTLSPLTEVPATLQYFKDAEEIFKLIFDFDVTVSLRNEAIDFPEVMRDMRTTGAFETLAVRGVEILVVVGVVVFAGGAGAGIDEKYTARSRVKVNPIFRTPFAVTDGLRVTCTRRMHRSTLVGMMFPSTI